MKYGWIIAITIMCSACAPSSQAIQTAIAQTQASMSPTPDLRIIKTDPGELMLFLSDLPGPGIYGPPGSGEIGNEANGQIIQEMGTESGNQYINATGRLDGWWVDYHQRGNNGLYPKEVYDNVIMFQTAAGAQLALTKYSDDINQGYTEIQDARKFGDVSRTYIKKDAQDVWYDIDFTYRNYAHIIECAGPASQVQPQFVEGIADALLNKLKSTSLSAP